MNLEKFVALYTKELDPLTYYFEEKSDFPRFFFRGKGIKRLRYDLDFNEFTILTFEGDVFDSFLDCIDKKEQIIK